MLTAWYCGLAVDFGLPHDAVEARKAVARAGERRVPEEADGCFSHVRRHRGHGGPPPHVRHCQKPVLDEQDSNHRDSFAG